MRPGGKMPFACPEEAHRPRRLRSERRSIIGCEVRVVVSLRGWLTARAAWESSEILHVLSIEANHMVDTCARVNRTLECERAAFRCYCTDSLVLLGYLVARTLNHISLFEN